MLKTILVASRDRQRLSEILQIASRFGLGVLLARLGLERGQDVDAVPDGANPLPRRVRLALEALGPTFVKLGQILATRSDVLETGWIAELEQLHSSAPTLDFEMLRSAVEEALGQPPETAFAQFDPMPLAAASIAQVHRATLMDGTPVVLKIRRPDIRPRMEADLRLIAPLAALAETASADVRRFQPAAMMRQLAQAVLEELDFTTEGRNADRLRADFADEPRVVIPEIIWEWSSQALLVMTYIDGVPLRDAATLRAAGIDPGAIASLGADVVLDMVLVNGRFHGDPHPGNLLALSGNRIALLDFGMIGHVSPRRREEFISFVQSFIGGDDALLTDVLMLWSVSSGVPRERVQSAAERLIIRHGGGKLILRTMVGDLMALMRDEGMTMPPDLLLIFKAIVTIDGVLSAVDPDFDLSQAMQRASVRVVQARLAPENWAPIAQALLWELAKTGGDAPRLVRAAVRRLEAEPGGGSHVDASEAVLKGARLIAGAVVLGAGMITLAIWMG